MELHQLKTLVEIARLGSVTRAAEQLELSQPAASAHLKLLEQALRLTLFERTARGMEPTEAGRRLINKAVVILEAEAQMLEEAAQLRAGVTGRLRIGIDPNTDLASLARLVRTLGTQLPRVELTVCEASVSSIVEGIRKEHLDVGLYGDAQERKEELTTIPTGSFGIVIAGPFGMPDRSSSGDWSDLSEWSWIYPGPQSHCAHAAEAFFKRTGLAPSRTIRVDRERVTYALIAAGAGVGLLHRYTAETALARQDLKILCDLEAGVRIVFAHLSRREEDPVVRAAATIVRQQTSL